MISAGRLPAGWGLWHDGSQWSLWVDRFLNRWRLRIPVKNRHVFSRSDYGAGERCRARAAVLCRPGGLHLRGPVDGQPEEHSAPIGDELAHRVLRGGANPASGGAGHGGEIIRFAGSPYFAGYMDVNVSVNHAKQQADGAVSETQGHPWRRDASGRMRAHYEE